MPDGTLDSESLRNAINLNATMAISQLAEQKGLEPTEMLLTFMASKTALMLYDAETGLWGEGPAAIVAEYLAEEQHVILPFHLNP